MISDKNRKVYVDGILCSTWERFAHGDSYGELKKSVMDFVSKAEPQYSDETDDNILEWFQNRAEELYEMGVMSKAHVEEFVVWSLDVFKKHGFVA